jgi:SAM-dependent methyltransferase
MKMSEKLLRNIARKIRGIWRYCKFVLEYIGFKRMVHDGRFSIKWKDRLPCLDDKTKTTGFDRHYIYHPAWAARILAETKPVEHIDISSTLNFATMLSAFIPVRFYDFRPADVRLSNLNSLAGNIVDLPFEDNGVQSISCMHVVEHIGLGRYGDPVDPEGDLKAIKELTRVLAVGGNLLFVVPVGKPKIMFNAHRIYSYAQVLEYFTELKLVSFALISERQEDGGLNFEATGSDVAAQDYGCGCFWFKK